MRTHRKKADPEQIDFEAAGLHELSRAANSGGAATAFLAERGSTWLETELIPEGRPSRADAHDFGRRLALTHGFTSDSNVFGQAPPEYSRESGFMGKAPLPLVQPGTPARSFGEFYAEDRILPYLPDALANRSLDSDGAAKLEALCERLRDGTFDSPQPSLVRGGAALLHGDLWNGNIMWQRDADGMGATIGTLIDPACHYGHAESDLAQLTVFGAPHVQSIFDGYLSISRIADGWEERRGIHQLHMLIVHAALFGGGYGHATIDVAQKYL